MSTRRAHREAGAVFIFWATALAILCGGCATYGAVVEAPADFWVTVEVILMAVVEDVWAIVDFLL